MGLPTLQCRGFRGFSTREVVGPCRRHDVVSHVAWIRIEATSAVHAPIYAGITLDSLKL